MKWAMLVLSLLFSLPAIAAEPDLGQKTITKGQILRGQFNEERILQGFNAPLKSNGHFVIAPEYGLIWSTDKPFAITTIIKPTGLTQKVNGKQTMDLPAEKVPFMTRLYNMLGGTLAGNWVALDADFIVTKSGTDNKWQVTLEPRQKDNISMPFSLITVTGSQFVDHVVMQKADGDLDSINFLNQKLSTSPLTAEEAAELK